MTKVLVWKPYPDTQPGHGDSGIGPGEDEFLVCWIESGGEERVEIDRWLGSFWKHRSPEYWAVIPLPGDA
jgi:hypothetical protein